MKKNILILLIVCLFFGGKPVEAKIVKITPILEATPTAVIIPTVVPKVNITQTNENEVKKYTEVKWNGLNSLKVAVNWAINRGVSTNTIVLLLLLPLVATLVSFLHYVLGLSGYGIFMPTMIAVTFLATGVFGGLALFALILMVSLLSGWVLKKLRLHFWPARAISLLMISVGTLILMVISSFVKWIDISQISIFPILFMILLAEEFGRTQLVKSKNEAKNLVLGTMILAMVGAGVMNFAWVQGEVLKYPDLVVILVLVVNLLVGNYTGMRLSEIKRFKKAIRVAKQNK